MGFIYRGKYQNLLSDPFFTCFQNISYPISIWCYLAWTNIGSKTSMTIFLKSEFCQRKKSDTLVKKEHKCYSADGLLFTELLDPRSRKTSCLGFSRKLVGEPCEVWGATSALKKNLKFSVFDFQASGSPLPKRDLPNRNNADPILYPTSFQLLLLHHLCEDLLLHIC